MASDVHRNAMMNNARVAVVQPAVRGCELNHAGLRRLNVRGRLLLLDAVGCLLGWVVAPGPVWATVAVFGLAATLLASARLYAPRLNLSALDDAPLLVGRIVIAGALLAAVLVSGSDQQQAIAVLLSSVCWAALSVPLRAVGYQQLRRQRARAQRRHPTLVVGAGAVGSLITARLLEHPEYGLRPVGLLDDDPQIPGGVLPVPVLGRLDALHEVVRTHGIRDLVIAFTTGRESDLVEAIRRCDRLDGEIYIVPRMFEMAQAKGMDQIWGFPLIRLPRSAQRSPTWSLKRAIDLALSAAALVLLSPVMGLFAMLVRRETGAGALFRQERVGLDGRPFELLKFQTLKPDTPAEGATRWTIRDDHRLGAVGRFLRRTSLDELPQLWNILRGDMTIVGPRPERPHFVSHFSTLFPAYPARHRVPAGLTGWAQIHNLRGDTSIEDRVRFDNGYIESWSLWGDVKIVLRTIPSVLRGSGG